MATAEDKDTILDDSKPLKPSKKQRTPGACDLCKKKKSDSAQMPGNRCTNCIQSTAECTHKEVAKVQQRGNYVESLENRLEAMERLFKKLLPSVDINKEINEGLAENVAVSEPSSLPRNDDDPSDGDVVTRMSRLHVDPRQNRFFGKSSGYQLIQTALEIRSEYTGEEREFGKAQLRARRLEFWTQPPWRVIHPELEPEPPGFIFPEADLIHSLVDAYFEQVNPFLPLLHRPSFEESVAQGLHYIDNSFGSTLLLVCALGSRYSEDPRVFISDANSLHSAGWKWFDQVPLNRKTFISKPSLSELQNHSLSAFFLRSTEMPQGCWTQLSMAMCMLQEIGAHRRRPVPTPTAENEEWKRVFWVLMSQHRLTGSFSGTPCILQDEDFDIEFPIECDDEYWNHPDPSLNFQQPPGKPSSMSFFICYLRLMDILAYAMRYIYSIKAPNLEFGHGLRRYSDQQIIVDLDSALNSWMDSVPDHLRWNPKGENKLFKQQSATLHATYYHLQIFIHRPFIPSFRNSSPTTFPSLAICTNAARSCCHVLDVQGKDEIPFFGTHMCLFSATVILLLNIWSGKRSGMAPHPRQDIEDVKKCFNLLKLCERRWSSAGRYWDILSELASAGDLSLSPPAAPSNKRPREDDDPQSQYAPRPPPGLKYLSNTHLPPKDSPSPPNFALPMYSNELGSLPIYGQFNFLDSHWRPERVASFRDTRTDLPSSHSSQTQEIFNNNPLLGPPFDNNTPRSNLVSSEPPVSTQSSFQRGIHRDWDFNHTLGSAHRDAVAPVAPLIPYGETSRNSAPVMDDDTLNMWTTAPTGFELDEWGTYISNVNHMTHGPFLFPNHHHH
ncbi:fungal-specific transcription factor domain-containing protein [Collybia nuda]|uniref:Fungal-specific transcription factor domain-containing protein n=1 Tax=Collybia nuda TaxID=64659 RepID=A0A9P5YEJ7_9AGAR|nr:fungal-specific transcription factor domain-containing protein [Collybia nuda]